VEKTTRTRRALGLMLWTATIAGAAFAWPVTASEPGAVRRSAKVEQQPFVPTTWSAPRPFTVALRTDEAGTGSLGTHGRSILAQLRFAERPSMPVQVRYGLQVVRDDGQLMSERLSDLVQLSNERNDVSETLLEALPDGYYIVRVTAVAKSPGQEMSSEDEVYWQVKGGTVIPIKDYMAFREVSAVAAPRLVGAEQVR
jgi:hypothetical protein